MSQIRNRNCYSDKLINGHLQRYLIKEQQRKEIIKKETGFHIIRINPDKEGLDIDDEISEIHNFIYESGKKLAEESTKKSLIEDLEKMTKMLKELCQS